MMMILSFVLNNYIAQSKHKSLVKGEIIEFELVKTDNGYKAKNVVSIKAES